MPIINLMSKKLAAIASTITYFLASTAAFAQTLQITKPENAGYANIQDFINAAIRLAFIIALIGVLVMLVWGAVAWIFSGGNKDSLDEARKRIINALIGLALLAVAFAIVVLAGQFVGINLLGQFTIPTPSAPTPVLPPAR